MTPMLTALLHRRLVQRDARRPGEGQPRRWSIAEAGILELCQHSQRKVTPMTTRRNVLLVVPRTRHAHRVGFGPRELSRGGEVI